MTLWVSAINLQLRGLMEITPMCQRRCFLSGVRDVLGMMTLFILTMRKEYQPGFKSGLPGGIQSCGSQMNTASLEQKLLMPSNHLRLVLQYSHVMIKVSSKEYGLNSDQSWNSVSNCGCLPLCKLWIRPCIRNETRTLHFLGLHLVLATWYGKTYVNMCSFSL